jgi:hypothetical protein
MRTFYLSFRARAPIVEPILEPILERWGAREKRAIILRIRRVFAGLLATILLGGACGGTSPDPPLPVQTTLPQVIAAGGPVLTAPKVQPILYSSDASAADIMAFLQEISTTSYWAETTSEYGVGALTVLPAITLTTAAPATISDDMLQTMLADNTSGDAPVWGVADPSTIYLYVLPPGTIEQDSEGACCTDYDGYHYEADVGTGASQVTVPYALSCACSGFDGPNVTDLQERTVDMSHEIVESSTDPFPDSNPAYDQEDAADAVWTLVTDGEVADMCEFNDDANVIPPGSTYMVQRSWSNAAAARFENPCVPVVTTTPYLNSFPQLVTVNYDDGVDPPFATQGETIPIGGSKTIDVVLRSATKVSQAWTVDSYDYGAVIAGGAAETVLQPPKTSGVDGDTVRLTITPTSQDAYLRGEAFIIWSDYGNPGDPDFESQVSMGLITNN